MHIRFNNGLLISEAVVQWSPRTIFLMEGRSVIACVLKREVLLKKRIFRHH